MKLTLVRHLWGFDRPLPDALARAARQGYAAVEGEPREGWDLAAFPALLRDHGLGYVGHAKTAGRTVAEHFDSLRREVDALLPLGPRLVTLHSGRDAWATWEAVEFYGRCAAWERGVPLPIAHETHRSRPFFSPWSTRDVLRQVPGVKLTVDLSHWVCVAERLLDDCEDELALAARRCAHVHARVGHEQGPQVPDPSAPEWAAHVAAHVRWWRAVWDAQAALGRAELTVTPEFGPPPYLNTLPHTGVPVAELERVVEWMSAKLRAEFGA